MAGHFHKERVWSSPRRLDTWFMRPCDGVVVVLPSPGSPYLSVYTRPGPEAVASLTADQFDPAGPDTTRGRCPEMCATGTGRFGLIVGWEMS